MIFSITFSVALVIFNLYDDFSASVGILSLALFGCFFLNRYSRKIVRFILLCTLIYPVFVGVTQYVLAIVIALNLVFLFKLSRSEEFAVDFVSLCIYEKLNIVSKFIIWICKINPDYPVGHSASLACYSAEKGNFKFANYLIEKGADPDKKTMTGVALKILLEGKGVK